MKNDYVDIIIPVYNNYELLEECFESIENQSYEYLHPIIVNDCSTDSSLKLIKNYKDNSKYDVTVLNNTNNMGVSYSRNKALEEVYGEFLTFLDADDFMLENHIKVLVDLLKKHKKIRLAVSGGGSHLKLNPKNFKSVKVYDRNDGFCELIGVNGIQGFLWNKIFYVEDIKKYGIKFDDRIYMGEDLLFVCQLYSKLNSGIVYNPHITYYYRPNPNSALRKKQDIDGIKRKNKNWFETYKSMIKAAENSNNKFSSYAFKLLYGQYYYKTDELFYMLHKAGKYSEASKLKVDFLIFFKKYFITLLFSKFIILKTKRSIISYTFNNLMCVFRRKVWVGIS